MYYDAFESPDAMKGVEEPGPPPSHQREEELSALQQRARQLEARRGRITAKKVYLKNKKVRRYAGAEAVPQTAAVTHAGSVPQQEVCIDKHKQKRLQRHGSSGSLQQVRKHADCRRTQKIICKNVWRSFQPVCFSNFFCFLGG